MNTWKITAYDENGKVFPIESGLQYSDANTKALALIKTDDENKSYIVDKDGDPIYKFVRVP